MADLTGMNAHIPDSMYVVISFLVQALTYLSSISLSRLFRDRELINSVITEEFMAERTHNDTVMSANLTTQSEKKVKRRSQV